MRYAAFLLCLALAPACDSESSIEEPRPCDLTREILLELRIDEVAHAAPVLPGTQFVIRGENFVVDDACAAATAALVPDPESDGLSSEVQLNVEVRGPNEAVATLAPEAAEPLIEAGSFTGAIVVRYTTVTDGQVLQAESDISFDVADTLTPSISGMEQTEAYLNDPMLLQGDSFLAGSEGTTEVVVAGNFTPEGGAATAVDVRLPATAAEGQDREQASFLWSPLIGGLTPGSFEGTITAINVHADGGEESSAPLEVSVFQEESTLFRLEPDEASLGSIVEVQGRGFIGPPDGTTVIRLEGEFTPLGGTADSTPIELIGTWVSGTSIQYVVTITETEDEQLAAVDFGTHRGRFEGTATPVLTMGEDPAEGIGTDVTFTLGPVVQVVHVRFLTGFTESLDLFGLGAVEDEIRARIMERMSEIYCPPDTPESCVNVRFVTDEPTDFFHGGYAILEIGGPDPNNMGLFGYDNTGTKDVNNLRLHDHVGGENALGDVDGFAYGGVFVDSLLYWSEHPPFDDRPEHAPDPDPRFDEIFDELREREVVAGEYPDGDDEGRVAAIEAAIDFLANVVADTGAHEFAHSLGLAQPGGPEDEIHNAEPGEGCLMDAGVDRPLVERARLDGNPGARFCEENLAYLLEILPTE